MIALCLVLTVDVNAFQFIYTCSDAKMLSRQFPSCVGWLNSITSPIEVISCSGSWLKSPASITSESPWCMNISSSELSRAV